MAPRREKHVDGAARAVNAAPVSSPPAPPTTPPALRGEPLRNDEDDEDDEGDAPEELSQGVARDRAMRSLKEAEDSRKREKADVKEKRRLKHELYTEQKKRKMLSEDILKAVGEAKSRKPAGPTKEKLSGHHGTTTMTTRSRRAGMRRRAPRRRRRGKIQARLELLPRGAPAGRGAGSTETRGGAELPAAAPLWAGPPASLRERVLLAEEQDWRPQEAGAAVRQGRRLRHE
uniref:Nucleolar protein 7 n=1 Tax=Petromyzon marinus TaxID=7757 RepID=A0AAJ7UE21_PETMA|nr:nucleolar protein 7 [Petromyzon marinus]